MRFGPTELIIVLILVGFLGVCVLGGFLVKVLITASKRSNSPGPVNSVTTFAEKSPQTRLVELNDLLQNNLISQEEYSAKKAEIIKQI